MESICSYECNPILHNPNVMLRKVRLILGVVWYLLPRLRLLCWGIWVGGYACMRFSIMGVRLCWVLMRLGGKCCRRVRRRYWLRIGVVILVRLILRLGLLLGEDSSSMSPFMHNQSPPKSVYCNKASISANFPADPWQPCPSTSAMTPKQWSN